MIEESNTRPKLVGRFIRERREAVGLSQRALGLLFNPPVTTQFISNLERGVTPLPLNHVSTLTRALKIEEAEMMALLEKEYTLKISGRLGRSEQSQALFASGANGSAGRHIQVEDAHFPTIKNLYEAYRQADEKTRSEFHALCESLLRVSIK